jgi:preprotein translocase subunit SecA
MYDPANIEINHHVQQGLRAHVLYHRDKDYVVKEGEVIIVDEFTGRLMPGRRWSDGLHQAVEAKEAVKIERENQTLATVSFQNYFRMYKKLAGMTGTAETEAAEFGKTYNIDVIVAPPNKPMIRKDNIDIVYRTEEEKFRNAAKEIKACHERGQPVLVGTISIEKSEKLAGILKRMGVPHEVLNAKNHEREAYIVAQAGRKGAVTVSTNMAGRGTDILLGGNAEYLAKEHVRKQGQDPDHPDPDLWQQALIKYRAQCEAEHNEVVELGGLHIVGTERHESRRIDNQLRGRAGRQGDPGSSRFYLSLQDDLMRIFGGERVQNLMLRLGMEEDVPIESGLITKRIAAAQKAVEAQHFAARKHLLEYDDVMNKQRKAIYAMRRSLLEGENHREEILNFAQGIVASLLDLHVAAGSRPDQWDLDALEAGILNQFGVKVAAEEFGGLTREEIEEHINQQVERRYQEKEDIVGADVMRQTERIIMLNVIDSQWKDHLLSMDHLREGIGLRGYGQKDPLIEYKKESFSLYEAMRDRIEDETVRHLFFLQAVQHGGFPYDDSDDSSEDDAAGDFDGLDSGPDNGPVGVAVSSEQRRAAQSSFQDFTRNIERKKQRELDSVQFVGSTSANPAKQVINKSKNVGRNDPCPCGSGKKYKKCCGA